MGLGEGGSFLRVDVFTLTFFESIYLCRLVIRVILLQRLLGLLVRNLVKVLVYSCNLCLCTLNDLCLCVRT